MSLSEEERSIMVNYEIEKAYGTFAQVEVLCSFGATQNIIEPLIEPTRRLLEKIKAILTEK